MFLHFLYHDYFERYTVPWFLIRQLAAWPPRKAVALVDHSAKIFSTPQWDIIRFMDVYGRYDISIHMYRILKISIEKRGYKATKTM
jgi:hypothetical protein